MLLRPQLELNEIKLRTRVYVCLLIFITNFKLKERFHKEKTRQMPQSRTGLQQFGEMLFLFVFYNFDSN